MFERFVAAAPGHQTAVDLFRDRWVSRLPVDGLTTGSMDLFFERDPRPRQAAEACGGLEGLEVLELGSLEGGHTYQLEQLGAKGVLGIDASPEMYLKSLIAKEVLALKAQFLPGDFNRYLEAKPRTFDLVFACGVLYHMIDPVHTLYLIAQTAPRVFIWTHYLNEAHAAHCRAKSVTVHGFTCDYYEVPYDDSSHSRGWAGIHQSAHRIERQTLLDALHHVGFVDVKVIEDTPDHPGGPALTVAGHNPNFGNREDLGQRLERAEGEARYYRELCEQLREETSALQRQLNQPAEGAANVQQQLKTMLESNSWRLTEPLRRGRRWARRLWSS
ncbi:MAG: class I SAM-dependent methyltransferase [Candidatus Competibacterales bacterium]